MANTRSTPRLPFLDWMRGLAAAIMIPGHTYHSFASYADRQDAPYVFSQFFGGMAPAIFLFLTGITFAMGMDRPERQDLSGWGRTAAALKRARYLFLLAFLFRIQLWLFGLPASNWRDLLNVDILNCMGLTMALLAPLAIHPSERRVRAAAGVGVVIAALAPLISLGNWNWLPSFLSDYFVPSYTSFSLFPWGAFLAFGIAAGSVLTLVAQHQMHRVMQWATLAGFGLILGGQYFSSLPFSLYAKSEFWLNSPALVASKMGVVLLVAAVAFLWTEHHYDHWSWLRQLGVTSLLVYWVHIELVYGRWFGRWKGRLGPLECALAAAVLLAAMVALSLLWTRLSRTLRPRKPQVRPAAPIGKDGLVVREGLR